MNLRVGIGYDVHRLVTGRELILAGVAIPFEKGLLGTSDGDAATHAVIDALLGAAAMGDIGSYFPSEDPQYRDISSLLLLAQTRDIMRAHQWQIGNLDVTIVAQAPKLTPFVGQMKQQIAQTLSMAEDQIGIKAKTTDELGFTGNGEGIAAYAVAFLYRE